MALGACRECGKQVSKHAKACPHCGIDHPGSARTAKLESAASAMQGCGCALTLLVTIPVIIILLLLL